MDRQQFCELASQRLSEMNLDSLKFIDEGDDSLSIEIVSCDFLDKSTLKRINFIYEMIEDLVQSASFHVTIIPLTRKELADEGKSYRGQQDGFFEASARVASACQ